jgi:hypothetical protein
VLISDSSNSRGIELGIQKKNSERGSTVVGRVLYLSGLPASGPGFSYEPDAMLRIDDRDRVAIELLSKLVPDRLGHLDTRIIYIYIYIYVYAKTSTVLQLSCPGTNDL